MFCFMGFSSCDKRHAESTRHSEREASRLGDGGERDFAGGVEVRQVPGVGAGDGEGAGGSDAGPVEEVERAADLAGEIHVVGEGEFQRAAERDRDAGREGDRRIPGVRLEHHPQRAAGAHRQMLVDRDGNGDGVGS